MTTASNGFLFDANSRLMVVDLVGTAVPGTAVYEHGMAFQNSDGSLYVTSSAVTTDVVMNRGIAQRNDGAVYISNSAPSNEVYNSGLALSSTGVVFTAVGGTIDHYTNGLPFTSTSRLVTN